MGTSNFIKHLACNQCGSSDGNSLYDDGHEFCSVCSKFIKGNNLVEKVYKDDLAISSSTDSDDSFKSNAPTRQRLVPVPTEGFKACRGITSDTMKKYGVWTSGEDQYYPYFESGTHKANKIRHIPTKGFLVQGDIARSGLFGQSIFPSGGKTLTITEGELDALSVYQIFGSKYPSVSVKGASSAEKDVTNNWEYCNSFEQIVLCFDTDEAHIKQNGEKFYPGQEAANRVAKLFPLGKVRVVDLQLGKDANEYLQKGLGEQFKNEWWRAAVWTPVGIRLAENLWEEVARDDTFETQYYPWEGLNEFTSGIRLSEFVVINAPSGAGKTSIVKEIEHKLKDTIPDNYRIGTLHLEENNKETLLGLMSLTANKRLHLPEIKIDVTKDELKKYFDATFPPDRVVVYDHFGSNAIDEILLCVRHMSVLGCKYIFLDHLSIIVSDQSGDERKQLDEISTKLKTLCMELNISVIAVIHQNRSGEIRGTAGVEQLANIVMKLIRNKEDNDEWRRNVTKVVVTKNRFSGITGPACYLFYSLETGRLEELSQDQAKQYESGLSGEHVEDFKQWRTEEVVN